MSHSCGAKHGSGGVIVINGTVNGVTPNRLDHTSSAYPGDYDYQSYGVVLINGKDFFVKSYDTTCICEYSQSLVRTWLGSHVS